MKKTISLLLALVILVSAVPVFAATPDTAEFTVIYQEFNETSESAKQVAEWDNTILYTSVTPEMSYCSQLTPEGKIQFSYVRMNDGIIVVSDAYDVSDIYSRCKAAATFSIINYDAINNLIIENIADFDDVTRLNSSDAGSTRGFSTLSAAITDAFGSNYSSKLLSYGTRNHNSKTYTVRLTESQTTSNTTPSTLRQLNIRIQSFQLYPRIISSKLPVNGNG